jgi:hypothetical protein
VTPGFSHWLGFGCDLLGSLATIYAGTLVAWKNRYVGFYSLAGYPQVVFAPSNWPCSSDPCPPGT